MQARTFGETAPKMTAEAAEKWRQSYRRYRHRKHLEKSEIRLHFFVSCIQFRNAKNEFS